MDSGNITYSKDPPLDGADFMESCSWGLEEKALFAVDFQSIGPV
jgi:hypothetical protein